MNASRKISSALIKTLARNQGVHCSKGYQSTLVTSAGRVLSSCAANKGPFDSHTNLLGDKKTGGILVSPTIRHASTNTSKDFQDAVKNLSQVKETDNSVKLRIYALYKQATIGKNNTKKPGMLDLVGKAKWEAWNSLGDMSNTDAEKEYIGIVNDLLGKQSDKATPTATEGDGYVVLNENGVRTIKLNRPEKKNALTMDMYLGITKILKEANDDANVNVIVLTGTGDFFCSGNDLGNFANVTDPAAMAKKGAVILQDYIDSYIFLKKPIIALINGPAVGIAVTVLGLCDLVFATDKATFVTPFSSLGQSPEGCSSYIFPRVMGYAKASELLYFNQKITAIEAERCGLVTQVFPNDRFQAETTKRVKEIAELPVKSLVYSKELVRGRERDLLHQVNVAECVRLEERWQSEDCMNAIMKFFSQKAKL